MHVIANSQMVLIQFSDWINTYKNRALFVAYPSLPHLNNTSCSLFTTKYLSALFGPFFYSIKQLLQQKKFKLTPSTLVNCGSGEDPSSIFSSFSTPVAGLEAFFTFK